MLRDRGAALGWTCSEEELLQEVEESLRGEDLSSKAASPAASNPAQGPSILSVKDVSFRYADMASGHKPALDHISMEVPQGTSCALVGVMQHPERQLFAQTVEEDIAYGPRNMKLSPEEVARRVDHALALVGLEDKRQVSPFELSGGQKRLCALAGVLAMEPPILVLDEPTAGLDPKGRQDLHAVLDAVHQEGTTTIQVTHSMEDAARADEVVVLNESKILMAGTPHEVFSPEHADALRTHGLGLPEPLSFALRLQDLLGQGDLAERLGFPLTMEELASQLAPLLSKEASGSWQ